MMLSLISFEALMSETQGLAAVRRRYIERFFEDDEVFPFSMNLILREPYNPAGPAKFIYAGNGEAVDESRQLETWRMMSSIFPYLEVGKSYHFLCAREKKDKKTNYYPLLLVEDVPLSKAKSRSIKLKNLAEASPQDYLMECERANKEFLGRVTPKTSKSSTLRF
jgi:hypothetical protein